MDRALELAQKAKGRTSPNPLVGSVVVNNGQIVGEGYHQKAGGPHAEVFALDEAGEKARGATIYVTLEPCSHYGRTPPCSEKIIASGIKKAVIAMVDPNPKVAGKGIKQLEEAGIEVETGLREKEARMMNEIFLKYIVTGRPFVVLKAGMSLDGKIATRTGESRWITGDKSRMLVHQMRDQMDGIMVGIGTILADNPQLTTRLPGGQGQNPIRIIVDSKAQTPTEARVLDSCARTIIAVTEQASKDKINLLQEKGAEILLIKEKNGVLDLTDLIEKLGKLEITSLLLEGGSTLNGSMLQEGLVDKANFFIAPKIIGGKDAPGPVGGLGIEHLDDALILKKYSAKTLEDGILVEGYLCSQEL